MSGVASVKAEETEGIAALGGLEKRGGLDCFLTSEGIKHRVGEKKYPWWVSTGPCGVGGGTNQPKTKVPKPKEIKSEDIR